MKKRTIIIIVIVVILIIILLFFVSSNKVLFSDGTTTITNKDYNRDAKITSDILSDLNDIANVSSKSNEKKSIKDLASFIAKYPKLAIYAYKFIGSQNKSGLIKKGLSISNSTDTTLRKSIATESVTKKQPVFLTIIDRTFQGVQ